MDFYVILGIGRDAKLVDVKRAYRRLARRYHPDINPGDRLAAIQFERIAEAYATLSDPDRRRQYDVAGVISTSAGARSFGFEGFDFSAGTSGPDAPTFGDLFGEVLRARASSTTRPPVGADGSVATVGRVGGLAEGGAERGPDLHQTIQLSFEQALVGGPVSLTVARHVHCGMCRGLGRLHVAETRCSQCYGTGAVKSVRGHMVFSTPCSHCGGAGRHTHARCSACGGQQTVTRVESLTVNIPAGLADGARVRVPGKGHAGGNGGNAGDLYITVRVDPHPVFRREGDDLHVVVPIAVHEAALGARIDVPAPDGSARLRVPPGTQTGHRFRLRGRGIRSDRGGDLVVEVRIVLPRVLDERSKELLREFGRINADSVRTPVNEAV
jgi:molecular chaperone DnaJ